MTDNLIMVGLSVALTYIALGSVVKAVPLGLVLFLVLKLTILKKGERNDLAIQAEELARKHRNL